MADNDFYKGETPKNYEQKCPCVLVLDTSGSMNGEPINELNYGLRKFKKEVESDTITANRLEIAVVTFNSSVKVNSTFKLVNDYTTPVLDADGSTKLVDGVNRAIQVLETRKQWYKDTGQKYYRPYIILITDGYPDNDQNIDELSAVIKQGVDNKQFNFWPFGVLDADMDILKKISHDSFSPVKLKGVEFGKFFKWLSNSMSSVSKSREGDKLSLLPKSEDENAFDQFQISID